MTPETISIVGLGLGVALAVTGMSWNAVQLGRTRRPSVYATRLFMIGLGLIPLGAGLALILIPGVQPVLYVGAAACLALGIAALAVAWRIRLPP